jgi:hypothetical protein
VLTCAKCVNVSLVLSFLFRRTRLTEKIDERQVSDSVKLLGESEGNGAFA